MNQSLDTVAIFDKYAQQYQEKFMAYPSYVETYSQFYRLMTSDHKTILDVACGPGNIAKFFLSQNSDLDIFGIDLSKRMIQLAKKNCPSATFAVEDCRNLTNIKKKFDVIVSGFCFPYLNKVEIHNFLKQASRLLNPKGLIYISTMDDDEKRSGFVSRKSNEAGKENEGLFTYYHPLAFLKPALAQQGFNILEHQYLPITNEDGSPDSARDLFIFAQCS